MVQNNSPKFDEKDQNENDQAARQKATRYLSEPNININVRLFFDYQNGQKRSQSFPGQLQQIPRDSMYQIPNGQHQIPSIQQPHPIDVLNFPKGKQNDDHSDDSGYSSLSSEDTDSGYSSED